MASRAPSLLPLLQRIRPPSRLHQSLPLKSTLLSRTLPLNARLAHSIPRPPQPQPSNPTPTSPSNSNSPPTTPKTENESERPSPKGPAYYQISFTCIPCSHRSHHNVSKQAYHHGSTLITCPGCRNRHVISDHLDIFGDRKVTVEELVRERGGLVKRGSLGEDGDIEFWPENLPEEK